MNASEIHRLRIESPRLFDVRVAEKMHGVLVPIEELHNQLCYGTKWLWTVKEYHSDANADLESHSVACGWDGGKYNAYFYHLREILCPTESGDALTILETISCYQIGDYSHAALLTKMEEK